MDRAVWKNLIPAIIFGFVTLFFIFKDINTWTNEVEGTYVVGHVVNRELSFNGHYYGRHRQHYEIEVNYDVDGVTYECFFNGTRRWIEGQEVELYYLGEPGGEVFLASGNPKFIWVLFLFATIFFIGRVRKPNKPLFGSEIAEDLVFGDRRESSEERDRLFLNEITAEYRNKKF